MALSENDRQALFAALVVVAALAAAYAFFFAQPPDAESDGQEFYYFLSGSDSAGIIYDVRLAQPGQSTAIYQCGVDIISKGRLAGKKLSNIACDSEGCISVSTEGNGTQKMGFEQAKLKLAGVPYLLITASDAPGYKFFQRHMEIYIGKNASNATRCDIAATES